MARITFRPAGASAEIQPMEQDAGLACDAGAILQRALALGVALDHSCGGMAACATCHCWIVRGADSLPAPAADELAMLERAAGRRPQSRLACQAVPDGSADVVVEIPPD